MCGIAGFSTQGFNHVGLESLEQMGATMAHRGPDQHGEYVDEQIGLAHRRLSILDLSEAGRQPMFSSDESLVLVFNGEIYNYPELRAEEEKLGASFRSNSDTEIILHLYAKYGTDCLQYLNGMFAFALWDKNTQMLFLARDRVGKKPLYYYVQDEKFAFASEIKALLTLPDVPREIRIDAVRDFFAYQYVPDPKSIFKHIHKLPAGHFMIFKDGQITINEYWDLSFSRTSSKDEDALLNDLKHITEACTKRRMMADVPLGAFLSGGVDSSGVVANMAKATETPVKTCTIGFDDEQYNESEFAKVVAEQYNTEHHEFTVHQNVSERLEEIVGYFDEPFADPSLVPTFFVSELARKAVTVAVAGDGGDEVFAGYEKYTTDAIENRLRQKFPSAIRRSVFPLMSRILRKIPLTAARRGASLLSSLAVSPARGFYITNAQMTDHQWTELVNAEFAKELGEYDPGTLTESFYDKADGNDHLAKILYTDIKTYLVGGILVKVDRTSMANSLEVRAPLLDKEVLEFAATLPSKFKFRDGVKKYILKKLFTPLLPDSILHRKKMGFSVPLATWLREELHVIAHKHLIADPQGLLAVFDVQQINKLWQQHQSKSHDHSAVLWSMLMYEMWWCRYACAR